MAAPVQQLVLVGELNPYNRHPGLALYDEPPYSAGGRLRRLILATTQREYLRGTLRHNLCTDKWSRAAAEAEAKRLEQLHAGRVVVLLGRRVQAAFGVGGSAAFMVLERAPLGLLGLPHPSGLCRAWNEDGAYARARRELLEAAPWATWIGSALQGSGGPPMP